MLYDKGGMWAFCSVGEETVEITATPLAPGAQPAPHARTQIIQTQKRITFTL